MRKDRIVDEIMAACDASRPAPQACYQWQIPVALGAAGAASSFLGTRRPTIRPYMPSRGILKAYEARQGADVMGLYTGRPYESPELGYSPEEKEASLGQRGAEFEAARQGEEQTIQDTFRRFGGRHLQGTEFRALQRARESDLARRTANRRAMLLADAAQRRADWARRFGALTGAYQYGTGLLNAGERARYGAALEAARARGGFFQGLGGTLLAAGAGYAGGGGWAGAGRGILDVMSGGGSPYGYGGQDYPS